MAYSNNLNLPKARATAMQYLVKDKPSMQVVANRCGVHRSTIYRWKHKWQEVNQNVQLENFNRPNRTSGNRISVFRAAALKWPIPAFSSRPKRSPSAIPESVVELVIALRQLLKRCAEVVWFHLSRDNGVNISRKF